MYLKFLFIFLIISYRLECKITKKPKIKILNPNVCFSLNAWNSLEKSVLHFIKDFLKKFGYLDEENGPKASKSFQLIGENLETSAIK
jgi:hypothetical protein